MRWGSTSDRQAVTELSLVAPLYKAAMSCSSCFGASGDLHLPTIDLPQPRWVGPAYDASSPRVLVVMLNPGQGDGPQLEQNLRLKGLLHRYKNSHTNFAAVLEFQREHMNEWGRPQGSFLPFYTTGLGLSLDELAFINIALCATTENKYPRWMLKSCFHLHTAALVLALRPDVVLLSGSATHSFSAEFSSRLPSARVVPMLHYAHREGAEAEQREHARIRDVMAVAATAGSAR